jgi:uncharacterized protein DUF6504
LTDVRDRAYIRPPLEHTFDSLEIRTHVCEAGHVGATVGTVTKRFADEQIRVERDAGMPSRFEWRGRHYEVADVIGRWRIEGRWWADGRDREYWRVEARGGAVWDLYHDRAKDVWHMERLWD